MTGYFQSFDRARCGWDRHTRDHEHRNRNRNRRNRSHSGHRR